MVHSLLQLSERWLCHIWLVGRMKSASLEANLGWGSEPFSLSHSSFLSPSLWEVWWCLAEIMAPGTKP